MILLQVLDNDLVHQIEQEQAFVRNRENQVVDPRLRIGPMGQVEPTRPAKSDMSSQPAHSHHSKKKRKHRHHRKKKHKKKKHERFRNELMMQANHVVNEELL